LKFYPEQLFAENLIPSIVGAHPVTSTIFLPDKSEFGSKTGLPSTSLVRRPAGLLFYKIALENSPNLGLTPFV